MNSQTDSAGAVHEKTWPVDNGERRNVDQLVPYARNARKHSDEQISQIAGSIREFGFTNTILIDEEGTIIAGHGRVLAANRLGYSEVPVSVVTGWSDAKKQAYNLADNKLALNSAWDMDLLAIQVQDLNDAGADLEMIGFNEDELASFIAEEDAMIEDAGGGEDELLSIDNDSEEGRSNISEDYLKFGKKKIPLMDDELAALEEICGEYSEIFGSMYGFARALTKAYREGKADASP